MPSSFGTALEAREEYREGQFPYSQLDPSIASSLVGDSTSQTRFKMSDAITYFTPLICAGSGTGFDSL
jgi:hypothetical protein